MAVIVEVTSISPAADPTEPGQKISGYMSINITGDYDSPLPFQTSINYGYSDEPSRSAAIQSALDKICKLADQIKAGAQQAAAEHPVGG